MPLTNDAVSNAFQLLVSTVRDFYACGRLCLGASLKPILYQRANFDEHLLGFPRFGDFLRAAQAAGHVQLSSTPGGDIGVWPAGVKIPDRPPQPSGLIQSLPRASQSSFGAYSTLPSRPVRVRQDLWNAFNSFSVGWVYDPVADIALRESGINTQGLLGRSDLIKIPASVERVLGWMRSFANMHDPETNAQLSAALNGDSAPYQFVNLVRSNPKLSRAWTRSHIQQVLAAIEAWAASNNVHPKNLIGPVNWAVRPSTPQITQGSPFTPVQQVAPPPDLSASRSPTDRLDSAHLAGRLESLIDELIDGLVKLRGFLQIVGPK